MNILTPAAVYLCWSLRKCRWLLNNNVQKSVTLPKVEKLIHISLVNALNLLDTLLTFVALNYKGASDRTESEIPYYISACFRETIAHPNRIKSLNLDNLCIVRTNGANLAYLIIQTDLNAMLGDNIYSKNRGVTFTSWNCIVIAFRDEPSPVWGT